MATKQLPPTDILRQLFQYDPETGIIIRATSRRGHSKKGDHAGTVSDNGYLNINYKNKIYRAHRIAWKLFYDEEPPVQIDHINGNRLDNRICNLRKATRSQNNMNKTTCINSKTGITGVNFNGRKNRWRVRIGINSKKIHIGTYNSFDEAVAARKAAEAKYHGEYARN